MKTILYIKANPKPDDQSHTFRMSEAFITAYKKQHPDDNIITLDLYQENLQPFDQESLQSFLNGQAKHLYQYAQAFAAADKYVFAAPMWNLSFPSILKTYIDYVVVTGITFKYTAQGPVGLLADQGKKAVHIVARGGMYSDGPMKEFEMGDRYLRTILGFMGITDVTTIATELTGVLTGQELEASVHAAIVHAAEMATKF